MSREKGEYTSQKEFDFLVLLAIQDLMERDKRCWVRVSDILKRLAKNEEKWNRYQTVTPFSQKISDTLYKLKGDGKNSVLYYEEGMWYRGSTFHDGLTKAARGII